MTYKNKPCPECRGLGYSFDSFHKDCDFERPCSTCNGVIKLSWRNELKIIRSPGLGFNMGMRPVIIFDDQPKTPVGLGGVGIHTQSAALARYYGFGHIHTSSADGARSVARVADVIDLDKTTAAGAAHMLRGRKVAIIGRRAAYLFGHDIGRDEIKDIPSLFGDPEHEEWTPEFCARPWTNAIVMPYPSRDLSFTERARANREFIRACFPDLFVELTGGVRFDLRHPSADRRITPQLVARGLSRVHRFNGHGTHAITVAQHCVEVASRLEGRPTVERLQALCHDAEEVVTGDITTPMGSLLGSLSTIKHRIRMAIWASIGVPTSVPMSARIFEADREALFYERDSNGLGKIDWGIHSKPGAPVASTDRIPWGPKKAEAVWLSKFASMKAEIE